MAAITSLLRHLQSRGLIDDNDVSKVVLEKSRTQKSEEVVLQELGLVTEVDIAKSKAEIFGIPFVDLGEVGVTESILAEVNVDSLSKYRAVPFERGKDFVKIAMQDPFDIQATQALQRKYPPGTRIQVYITTRDGINSVLERRIGDVMSSEVSDALEDVPVTEISEDPNLFSSSDLSSAPVARIVNSMLQYAVTAKASDIHIEPLEKRVRVRFRINGIMAERLSLPRDLAPAIVSRIKILSNLKIDERRLPQDGRFPIKIEDTKIDLRVSVMPTIYGEKVVMRLLESESDDITLETTGLRGNAYKTFVDALSVTNGISLVTGPTGSGKTRTLASSLIKINDPKVNIISLEDPVEIRVPGVTQIQINPDIGLTFANGLRSVLRQDPDIVMVGEIRDEETAALAVQASLTGHLVLSTLHTNSAASAIPRLLDMGVESYLLASTLRCIVAQRLPRSICKDCIEAYPAPQEVVKNIKEVFAGRSEFDLVPYLQRVYESKKASSNGDSITMRPPEVGADGQPVIYLYRGTGCDKCGGMGYSGRIGIFEVLDVSEKISRMIMENASADEIKNIAVEEGMLTMLQDGYLKALEGITTIEEVLRVSKE
ncbi:MAG TPA: GspE/PulE family protein [Candidatus Dojkabacteria bacterium]|nr:GspE/PulE family protein [Candidatus Dojkabacteria bacterium]